jgi:hypothetical protein
VTAAGTYDQVVVLQDRGGHYATLHGANALRWESGAAVQSGVEVFIHESTSYGFTLKSISNGNFVEIQDKELRATGTSGVIINIEACGTNSARLGVLRADTTADGNALNDAGNNW